MLIWIPDRRLGLDMKSVCSEVFIYSTVQAGIVPLKLYFNKDMNEYYSTTPQTGEKVAIDEDFEFVRTEGYIMPATKEEAAPSLP